MRSVESTAKTRQEAIKKALEQLGAELHEVQIEILDEGSRGIFGIGARDVKVKLTLESDVPTRRRGPEKERDHDRERPRGERDRGREERPRGERDRGREERPRGERDDRERVREERPRGERRDRDRSREERPRGDRERDRDRGRGQRPDRPAAREEKPARPERPERGPRQERQPQRPARQERPERPERQQRPERRDRPERHERPERPRRQEPRAEESAAADRVPSAQPREDERDLAPVTDARREEAAALLAELVGKMGIEAKTSSSLTEDGRARVNVESVDSAILIGRKGRNLQALQYLLNRMMRPGEGETVERFIVDVESYLDRRRENLEEMARHLAERAKETGRDVRVKPLSAQERRIIHLTLQDDPDVRTFSLGSSSIRTVVISPKNQIRGGGRDDGRSRRPRGGRGRREGRSDSYESSPAPAAVDVEDEDVTAGGEEEFERDEEQADTLAAENIGRENEVDDTDQDFDAHGEAVDSDAEKS